MSNRKIVTPSPPVDVAKALPWLAPHAKQTVRLHPRPGRARRDSSKIGGTILWPKREQWPVCAEHDCPYVVAIQLRKRDVPEITFRRNTDLMQVLWCPNPHGYDQCPQVEVFWRSSRLTGHSPDHGCPVKAEKELVPKPCVVHPERVTEFPEPGDMTEQEYELIKTSDALNKAVANLGVEAFGHWDIPQSGSGLYFSWLSTAYGTKVGGYPRWIQDPPDQKCESQHPMEILMSFASVEFDGGSWGRWLPVAEREILSAEYEERVQVQAAMGCSFGDSGSLYVFVCRECSDWPIKEFIQSC